MSRSIRTILTVLIAAIEVPTGISYLFTGTPERLASAQLPPAAAPVAAVEFTPDGKVKQPVGYRKWVHLGTPLTPKDKNPGNDAISEFHSVYMDPESFAHYEKTGEFRDGTVVLKELIGVGDKEATSGTGYFMGEFTGLELAVKDSKRFPNEPGHWAYFLFGEKYPLRAEAIKEEVASCSNCHQENAKTDWVFSQYYPVLRAAVPRSK